MKRTAILTLVFAIGALGAHTVISCDANAQSDLRSSDVQSHQLLGLHLIEVKKLSVENREAIELIFDEPSSARLRQFTQEVLGRRITFFIDDKKLATLRLREAVTDGRAQLTGEFDQLALKLLMRSPPPAISLKLE